MKDKEDFLANLQKVFERLRKDRVILNPKKCRFGMKKVEYVGHVVSAEGISFTDQKRGKVLEFPVPKAQKDMQAFLGLVNYFRGHVPNMTELVKPLVFSHKERNKRND